MYDSIKKIDLILISFYRKNEEKFARFAIFLVYFWFGVLKLIGLSPATPLVKELYDVTIGSIGIIPFTFFYPLFSLLEVTIGILFLIRGLERPAILLLAFHLVTTILPLIFLPQITWHSFLVPTLEGQYIIKNILIAACAIVVGSKLVPISSK
ncbi:MAG: hypothetical protein Q8L47_03285 [bacterium]|nr:hypothetical protein [bacterium]